MNNNILNRQEMELNFNMVFNVLYILTNGFANFHTSFKVGTLNIIIDVFRESPYLYGGSVQTGSRSDEDLFINLTSTWRFGNYRIVVQVKNLTVDQFFHDNQNTSPPRIMRPAYIDIHPPGTFQNRDKTALFSFIYLITNAFTPEEKTYYIGPYKIIINVEETEITVPSLDYTYTCHNLEATLLSFHAVVKMMKYKAAIIISNTNLSTIFEIVPARPFETAQMPPPNFLCRICMNKKTVCTMIPCKHYMCYDCTVTHRMYLYQICPFCVGRIQNRSHILLNQHNFF